MSVSEPLPASTSTPLTHPQIQRRNIIQCLHPTLYQTPKSSLIYNTAACVRRRREVALDDGLGSSACGGVKDEDGIVVSGALAVAVSNDAAVIGQGGSVLHGRKEGGRRVFQGRIGKTARQVES
jgi:hypothetical protein